MSLFQMNPRIYSLLICAQVDRDSATGAWRLTPLSHLAVRRLPVPVNMVLCASVLAPPGEYEIAFSLFHSQEDARIALANATRIQVQSGKNLEYKAQVSITLRTTGLYLVEAALKDYDTVCSPIRVSTVPG